MFWPYIYVKRKTINTVIIIFSSRFSIADEHAPGQQTQTLLLLLFGNLLTCHATRLQDLEWLLCLSHIYWNWWLLPQKWSCEGAIVQNTLRDIWLWFSVVVLVYSDTVCVCKRGTSQMWHPCCIWCSGEIKTRVFQLTWCVQFSMVPKGCSRHPSDYQSHTLWGGSCQLHLGSRQIQWRRGRDALIRMRYFCYWFCKF